MKLFFKFQDFPEFSDTVIREANINGYLFASIGSHNYDEKQEMVSVAVKLILIKSIDDVGNALLLSIRSTYKLS